MASEVTQVVIVGGGSAGWLTAGYLAAQHKISSHQKLTISVIESPDVATIGVGEGTWPSMRNTLERIGISEKEFLSCCDGAFKQGSKFVQWRKADRQDNYYHPFTLPEGFGQLDVHNWWKQQSEQSFAEFTTPQIRVCEAGKAPKQLQTPDYAAVATYGYHLDSAKFAALLQRHCTETLGVQHIQGHISEIINNEAGDIDRLILRDGNFISGDLFIDCSGQQSLLLGQHFEVPVIKQDHILFNDSALACHVEYPEPQHPIATTTMSTAQTAGWIWDIGLPTRRGVGHVYCSRFISDQQAEQQLRDYIRELRGEAYSQSVTVRKLQFTPGYRQQFWVRNCVAIGMSSGFIEPLEASALAMVELSVKRLSDQFPKNRQHMALLSEDFNRGMQYHWQRIIDFLKLHYVLSERDDSPYWQANKDQQSIPMSLQKLLARWKYQPPSQYDLSQSEEVFPAASYQFVLYGMGFSTAPQPHSTFTSDDVKGRQLLDHCQTKTQKWLQGLPAHRDLLERIRSNYSNQVK